MKIPVSTCALLTADLRRMHPAGESLFLAFEQCAIEVRLNSRALLDKLSGYFKPFLGRPCAPDILISVHQAEVDLPAAYTVKSPDAGKRKIKEEYVDLQDGRLVHKRLTDMFFVFGDCNNLAIGPCLENDNQVINFINNRFIEWKLRQGSLLGHAAGVIHKNRGLALCGFSGMGKSTLALRLMSMGASFVSNDRLMIDKTENGCRMTGVAKLPRVNPGTVMHNDDLRSVIPPDQRRGFENLSGDELWTLEHKFDADIDECFGPGRFVLSAPMHGLAVLNWQRENGPTIARRVRLDDRLDLLPAFMKETGLFYLPDGKGPHDFPAEKYLEILQGVPVIELCGGIDFLTGAAACMEFLEDR